MTEYRNYVQDVKDLANRYLNDGECDHSRLDLLQENNFSESILPLKILNKLEQIYVMCEASPKMISGLDKLVRSKEF
jgi:hypothetical protein